MSRLQAGRRHPVRFSLNGKPCAGEAEPRLLLTDFLRHQIGMTGTHVGCEHGVCWRLHRQHRRSARRGLASRLAAAQVEGCEVRTVEVALRRRPGPSRHPASGVQAQSCASVWLLHRRHPDVARLFAARSAATVRSHDSRFSERPSLSMHRICPDHTRRAGGGGGNGGRCEQRDVPCLILEPVLLPAWRAIPMRWRSSMAAFA